MTGTRSCTWKSCPSSGHSPWQTRHCPSYRCCTPEIAVAAVAVNESLLFVVVVVVDDDGGGGVDERGDVLDDVDGDVMHGDEVIAEQLRIEH